jgi:phosphatidylserine/phosphatidylglycerophosphate/cardiolipin synthase-like enzyme
MAHSGSRSSSDVIEVRRSENFYRQILGIMSATQEKADFCMDNRGLSILVSDKQLVDVIKGLVNAGVKLRFIINITPENISFCKLLLKYCQTVYHADWVNGNFLIIDAIKYLFYVLESDNESGKVQDQVVKQVLFNDDKSFVVAQQFLFENVCGNSIPAKEKIKEIERGYRGEFTDMLDSGSEIQKIAINILESASYEVLVLFSTPNLVYLAARSGILSSLWRASKRGVTVKMLIQSDPNQPNDVVQEIIDEKHSAIVVQHITKPLQSKIATLVIDQTISLAIDAKEDNSEKKFSENIMIAIYSNNESTVSSSTSIFETLWIQSEFDKQTKVKQAYFEIFKGHNLKDETYNRRWSSSDKEATDK